ncbi:MAG: class I SAM-dependent methyltransferase [Candidatus Tectomicrobia bacterium]|nr:class I SAM-dependent methyltransferase [Candidatus Tectomicrobia bacterium]
MPVQSARRLWAWDVSARVYEWAYIQVAHQTDADLLAYLGERVIGATVADCGCGPGVVSEKFLRAGAATVVAIDSNAGMIDKARVRLTAFPFGQSDGTAPKVVVRQCSHEGDALRQLAQEVLGGGQFDIVLFKRSLYMPRPRAVLTLRQAATALRPQGVIAVVHPERTLQRYAFAPPFGITRYTPFHLFNRAISRVAERCGAEEYTLYSRSELLALLREAVPGAVVETIPSRQRPYNLAVLTVP